jgi:hypothetical protein
MHAGSGLFPTRSPRVPRAGLLVPSGGPVMRRQIDPNGDGTLGLRPPPCANSASAAPAWRHGRPARTGYGLIAAAVALDRVQGGPGAGCPQPLPPATTSAGPLPPVVSGRGLKPRAVRTVALPLAPQQRGAAARAALAGRIQDRRRRKLTRKRAFLPTRADDGRQNGPAGAAEPRGALAGYACVLGFIGGFLFGLPLAVLVLNAV